MATEEGHGVLHADLPPSGYIKIIRKITIKREVTGSYSSHNKEQGKSAYDEAKKSNKKNMTNADIARTV
jgi:hypothetical protein